MRQVSPSAQRTHDWIAGVLDAVEAKVEEITPVPGSLAERSTWLSVAEAGRRLLQTADLLKHSDPVSAESIIFDLAQMLKGLLEGSRFLADAQIEMSAPVVQAAKAREALENKRKSDPRVQAFHRAFDEALVGKTPERIASREFVGSILDTINKSLAEAGFEPVSNDTVRRRLKKARP